MALFTCCLIGLILIIEVVLIALAIIFLFGGGPGI